MRNPLLSLQKLAGAAGLSALALFSLALLMQPVLAHDYKLGDLVIDHPWSRATPEGAKVAAGYAIIRNEGAEADRLVAASGEIAGRTEIHEMAIDGEGVMRMRHLAEGLEIPAGGEVALKPGSFHIMFLELERNMQEGERFKGMLTFEEAGSVEVEFAVEALAGGSGHDHDHSHDHDHDHDHDHGDDHDHGHDH